MAWDDDTFRTIEAIYDSVDAEQGWKTVLERVAKRFDASGAHIFLRDIPRERYLENDMYGWGDVFKREYERMAHLDPRAKLGKENPGVVINDLDHFDDAFFESTRIYNEFLKRGGVRHSLTVTLPLGGGLVAGFAILRPKSIGGFGRQEGSRLELLLPHMMRALQLQTKLRQVEDLADDVAAALDQLPTAAAIVSTSLDIVCLNRKAEALVDQNEGLSVRRGQLTAEQSQEADALRQAVSEASAQADGVLDAPAVPPPVVSITRKEKLDLDVLAVALRPRYRLREQTSRRARVLLLIYDPERHLRIDPRILERLFKLTPAEACVAALIAEGKSAAQIAERRRCSESTVRTQIKHILRKTRTNRQAELVQLILTSPAISFDG